MKRSSWIFIIGGIIASISLDAQIVAEPGAGTKPDSISIGNTAGQSVYGPGAGHGNLYRKPIPYTPLREADVMWSKRVWRTMDLREKMNHPYYFPLDARRDLQSLFDVIKSGIRSGQLTAFGNPVMDDEFNTPLSRVEAEAIFVQWDSMMTINPENGNEEMTPYKKEIGASDVVQYWIKEEWFVDKQRSVMDVRILGICPLVQKVSESGEVVGLKPLFWIYFPEARPVLAKSDAYLGINNGQRLTFDDLFMKRMFASYIHKESNVYDRWINSYMTGMDALLESEKVKEGMMNFEHDLWHY